MVGAGAYGIRLERDGEKEESGTMTRGGGCGNLAQGRRQRRGLSTMLSPEGVRRRSDGKNHACRSTRSCEGAQENSEHRHGNVHGGMLPLLEEKGEGGMATLLRVSPCVTAIHGCCVHGVTTNTSSHTPS